ncbi:MAG TPA: crossover junction endodeoxyribonuclease RuvC [Desulfobacteraceae bacterium]|nr:crossover junction endodeoxyribonuclease RuvC [Desulfobacteraceae bacterium]
MRTRSRILGIDPGSRTTGYGIIDKQGSSLGFVACGTIRTGGSANIPERLLAIYEGLEKIITLHGPDVAAVEEVFMARNPRSALTLGHAHGAAVLAVMRSGLRVHDYSPRLVKQAVAGYGRADKAQVQHMVTALLDLSAAPSSDAADALAVAICHANRMIVPEDASS